MPRSPRGWELTEQHKKMIILAVCGYSIREIGNEIGTGHTSVSKWMTRYKDRMGVNNIAHLIVKMIQQGYISIDEIES